MIDGGIVRCVENWRRVCFDNWRWNRKVERTFIDSDGNEWVSVDTHNRSSFELLFACLERADNLDTIIYLLTETESDLLINGYNKRVNYFVSVEPLTKNSLAETIGGFWFTNSPFDRDLSYYGSISLKLHEISKTNASRFILEIMSIIYTMPKELCHMIHE